MKKLLIILALTLSGLLTYQSAQAQYKVALGGRIGPDLGFTIKFNLAEHHVIEGIVGSRLWYGKGYVGLGGLSVTALYEYHGNIGNIDGFRWFVGGGVHTGFWAGNGSHKRYYENRMYVNVGLDAIGGIEYTFPSIPLNLSVDYKPAFDLLHGGYIWWQDSFAISVRYAIK